MESFYNDSLNQVLVRTFTWDKIYDVAKRAASLYIAGAIFGSSQTFNYLTVVGVSAVRFDYINVLQQPLDAILFNLFDAFFEILVHYAVLFSLHYSSEFVKSTAAELIEMWHSNSKIIITCGMGFYYLLSSQRGRGIRSHPAIFRSREPIAWWNTLKTWLYGAVVLLISGKIIDDAWARFIDTNFDRQLSPFLPTAFLIYRDIDSGVKTYKRQAYLDIGKWILFQIWRILCWPLGPVKDPLVLAEGYPYTLELSDRPDYQYREFRARREIRLLKLEKSTGAKIDCRLIPFPLQNIPHYECISYTWGNASQTHEIFIDGYRFRTTETVYSILQAQSSHWRTKYIWIDSICIDQRNNAEKTHQVAMMGEIYRKASRVIVWLGDFDEAFQATKLLAELRGVITEKDATAEGIYKMYLQKSRSANWSSLIKLLKLPWFHRIWVVQEVALARKLRVLVGGRYFDWENLLAVIQVFTDPALSLLLQEDADFSDVHSAIDGMQHVLQMAHFRRITQQNRMLTLTSYLSSTSGFMSTDPRDRIFALFGLVDATNFPVPDYSLSIERAYFNIACSLIFNSGEPLFILAFAGTGYARNQRGLPSWVPDWSVTRNGRSTLGHAGSGQGPQYYCAGGLRLSDGDVHLTPQDVVQYRTLHLSGIFVDTIEHAGKLPGDLTTEWDASTNPWLDYHSRRLQIYHEAKEFSEVHKNDLYPSGCSRKEAFWRTLVGDTVGGTRPAPIEYGSYCEEWEGMTENIFSTWSTNRSTLVRVESQDEDPDPEPREYIPTRSREDQTRCHHYASWTTATARYFCERRFCVTKSGYFGLFPPGSRVGDRICVILGGQTPFLLREYPSTQTWEFVGECYVHGIMDGEILEKGGRIESVALL